MTDELGRILSVPQFKEFLSSCVNQFTCIFRIYVHDYARVLPNTNKMKLVLKLLLELVGDLLECF